MRLLANISEERFRSVELAGWPSGWGAVLLLLGVVATFALVVWLYRRESRAGASLRLRLVLAGVRCAALLGLLVIWLEPVVANYLTQTIQAQTIVLVDRSASMGIRDAGDSAADSGQDGGSVGGRDAGVGGGPVSSADEAEPPTRLARVARLLTEADHAFLRGLAERNAVAVYTFGEQAAALARVPVQEAAGERGGVVYAAGGAPWSADADATDLGGALQVALAEAGERPIAGVIVLSDGNINSGLAPADAAALAAQRETAVHAVAVGGAREPVNVRVAELSAPGTAPKGDPIELRATVRTAGISPRSVPITLSARRADEPLSAARELETRMITIGEADEQSLRFEVAADEAGEFVYRVALPSTPDEALQSDNLREATVTVLETRLRVLLVSGRPSYAYRYLVRLLERDRSIDVSCWLQSADADAVRDGDTVITALPREPEELFAYDAILLLDPDPGALDAAWAISVRRFVDELGGGLLLQAGPHFATRLLRDEGLEELHALLPIVADPDIDVRLGEQGAFRTQPLALAVPDEAARHPVVQFASATDVTQQIWAALPGIYWYLPVGRTKPLATTLIAPQRSADANPLLAVQPFGAGRAAYLAFEDAWRWRATAERYFEQFWIQLIRYLAQARREGVSKRGTIVLDRESFAPGDFARIEARVLDDEFVPWIAPEIDAVLELPDGATRPLVLEAELGREGWFAARLAIDWAGPAVIRVPLPGADEAELVKRIPVEASDRELQRLALDEAALRTLAERSGGTYRALSAAGALAREIENASRVRTERGRDEPLWDQAWTMLVIAGLLAVEWTVRRRSHLL